jgi:hypothetical protein
VHHRPRLTTTRAGQRADRGRRVRLLLTGLAGGVALTGLSGCSGGADPAVSPAPRASDAACARALAALPARVLGAARTPLNVLAAAAWGEPAIVLRCGVPELGPSTDRCVTVDDVDWVVRATADLTTITSFGRSPAVEVGIPRSYGDTSAADAAVDLGPVARALPKTSRACVG